MSETDYCLKCRDYLSNVLGPNQSDEDRIAARMVLSNPMDLNTAAQILEHRRNPDPQKPPETGVRRCRSRLPRHPSRPAIPPPAILRKPLRTPSARRSHARQHSVLQTIQALLAHKMVLTQNDVDAEGKPVRKWVFRHDKIRNSPRPGIRKRPGRARPQTHGRSKISRRLSHI